MDEVKTADIPKSKKIYKLFLVITISVICLCVVLLIALFAVDSFGYCLIDITPTIVLIGVFIIATAVLIFTLIVNSKIKHVLKIVTCLLLIFATIFALSLPSFLMIFSGKENPEYYTSPDGMNKIVVFDSGFLDAYYTAYPVANKFFYFKNNDTGISRNDFGGGAEIELVWNENSVDVYIIFDENGRNENEKITVEYLE